MIKNLKFAVMGAGAVGCYYGGMLARAGHDVVLIARLQHVQAIASAGLRLQSQNFDESVHLKASLDASAVQGADVVLFCVKSSDTEAAGRLMQPFLQAGTPVLCLQNGVDNAERLRAVLPRHTVSAAVVYVATEMTGPGHVKHNGRGDRALRIKRHDGRGADRGWRADRGFKQCVWRTVGQADPQLRLQRCICYQPAALRQNSGWSGRAGCDAGRGG